MHGFTILDKDKDILIDLEDKSTDMLAFTSYNYTKNKKTNTLFMI